MNDTWRADKFNMFNFTSNEDAHDAEKLFNGLMNELEELQRWNRSVRVCADHTNEVVGAGCICCDLMNATANLAAIRKVADEQTDSVGLWFIARTGREGYLQDALRRLHKVIENCSKEAL